MRNKVSIAIPTYNRPAYLRECLRSVLGQTFQDFSVYVFDNASEEPVEKVIEEFGDSRIHYIRNEKNIGPIGNIHRILEYPFDSEYLAIFHDDDTMHPKKLALQASFLDANPDILFVGSDFKEVSDETVYAFASFDESKVKSTVYKSPYEFVRAEMSWLRCAFGSVLYRVEIFSNTRMQEERFSEFADLGFLMEISKKGPCAFLTAPLMNYRIHSGQHRPLGEEYARGIVEMISFCRESLPVVVDKNDERLLRTFSINFVLRACAHLNKGLLYFLKFLKKCHQQNLIQYRDFRYIDTHGLISFASILLGTQKVIHIARWARALLRS